MNSCSLRDPRLSCDRVPVCVHNILRPRCIITRSSFRKFSFHARNRAANPQLSFSLSTPLCNPRHGAILSFQKKLSSFYSIVPALRKLSGLFDPRLARTNEFNRTAGEFRSEVKQTRDTIRLAWSPTFHVRCYRRRETSCDGRITHAHVHVHVRYTYLHSRTSIVSGLSRLLIYNRDGAPFVQGTRRRKNNQPRPIFFLRRRTMARWSR